MVDPAAIAEEVEAKEEVEEKVERAEGKKVATLRVTVYENIPAKVEIVEKFPGFSFRHIKLAKVGMNRCFRKLRREESGKTTPIEEKQRKEAEKQREIDLKVEREMKEAREKETPTRQEVRHALAQIKSGKKE